MVKKSGRVADLLVARQNKKFKGSTATTRGKDSMPTGFVSTQCYSLDCAIGATGPDGSIGIPIGRLTVIQGAEASGKTTLVTQILAEVQQRGGITLYLDAESKFEAEHAAALGLYTDEFMPPDSDLEPLVKIKPDHIKDAFAQMEEFARNARELAPDSLIAIAWDSVAATQDSASADEKNADYDSGGNFGAPAKEVSQSFRRFIDIVAELDILLICVNQVKEKITTGFGGFGDKTTTIASKPLGFHATVRIVTAHAGFIGKGGKKVPKNESLGITVIAKVTKNQIAPPHREANFDIYYEDGIDDEGSIINMAVLFGIAKKSGGFLKYGETQFRRGQFSRDMPIFDALFADIQAEVAKRKINAVAKWQAEKKAKSIEDEDDVSDEDDEDLAPRPGKKHDSSEAEE